MQTVLCQGALPKLQILSKWVQVFSFSPICLNKTGGGKCNPQVQKHDVQDQIWRPGAEVEIVGTILVDL